MEKGKKPVELSRAESSSANEKAPIDIFVLSACCEGTTRIWGETTCCFEHSHHLHRDQNISKILNVFLFNNIIEVLCIDYLWLNLCVLREELLDPCANISTLVLERENVCTDINKIFFARHSFDMDFMFT